MLTVHSSVRFHLQCRRQNKGPLCCPLPSVGGVGGRRARLSGCPDGSFLAAGAFQEENPRGKCVVRRLHQSRLPALPGGLGTSATFDRHTPVPVRAADRASRHLLAHGALTRPGTSVSTPSRLTCAGHKLVSAHIGPWAGNVAASHAVGWSTSCRPGPGGMSRRQVGGRRPAVYPEGELQRQAGLLSPKSGPPAGLAASAWWEPSDGWRSRGLPPAGPRCPVLRPALP